jgi:predicted AlkP superfamily phosphohydrolase/phosphomutase
MILFGESDGSGHQFWRYCDPNSPLFSDQPGVRDSILRVYKELDRQTAELLALVPADTLTLMMSDHGFGGVGDWVIYPNAWLQQQGLATLRRARRGLGGNLLNRLKMWGVATLPAWLQRKLYRSFGWLLGRLEARVRYGMIDWSKTEAYFDENPYFPVLRVNLKGRQPGGIVEPGKHYEEVRDRCIRALESWRHPQTGEPIVEKAYRREEVYSGPYVELAPDIVPKWALLKGYSYSYRSSAKAPAGLWIEQIDPHRADSQRFYTGKSGTHRDHGIFLAQGAPTVREGVAVDGARIIDLAPTILHLLDVAVPEDMDGRVLEEIFTAAYNTEHPVRTSDAPAFAPAAWQPEEVEVYSAEDKAIIQQRLDELGYGGD